MASPALPGAAAAAAKTITCRISWDASTAERAARAPPVQTTSTRQANPLAVMLLGRRRRLENQEWAQRSSPKSSRWIMKKLTANSRWAQLRPVLTDSCQTSLTASQLIMQLPYPSQVEKPSRPRKGSSWAERDSIAQTETGRSRRRSNAPSTRERARVRPKQREKAVRRRPTPCLTT